MNGFKMTKGRIGEVQKIIWSKIGHSPDIAKI